MTNNDLIKTIETYKQATAIRIRPNDTEAHDYLGVQYFRLNNLDSAMQEYSILKELDRDEASKLFKLINPYETEKVIVDDK